MFDVCEMPGAWRISIIIKHHLLAKTTVLLAEVIGLNCEVATLYCFYCLLTLYFWRPHPIVLRTYSWLHSWGSLLLMLREPYMILGN